MYLYNRNQKEFLAVNHMAGVADDIRGDVAGGAETSPLAIPSASHGFTITAVQGGW